MPCIPLRQLRVFGNWIGLSCFAAFIVLASGWTVHSAIQPEPRSVLGVAFSPDGKFLATATGQSKETGSVALWDIGRRKAIGVHGKKRAPPAVTFAPDGKSVAIALFDQAAKILDVATSKELEVLRHP